MNAPKLRHARSSLNGRSVHAGLVGHELRGLPVHIKVRIQILATEHLMIGGEFFYHSHRGEPKVRRRIRLTVRGLAEMIWLGRTQPLDANCRHRPSGSCFVAHNPSR